MKDKMLYFYENCKIFKTSIEQIKIVLSENKFEQAKEMLLDFISNNPKEEQAKYFYLECLLELNEFDEVHSFVESLEKEIQDKDENDNVLNGDIMTYNAKDNYILSKSKRLIVAEGLEGYLVADFEDVLLICKKEDSGIFREFVSDIKEKKGDKLI